MNKNFNILFYLKKSKIDKEGKAPIYMRITIDGKRNEISTKRYIDPERWDSKSNKVIGKTSEVKEINSYLDVLTSNVYDNHRDLILDRKTITSETLKNKILGVEERDKKVMNIFNDHNKKAQKLEGREFSKSTIKKYFTVASHVQDFLKHQYHVSDISINEVDFKFVTGFDFYLRSEKGCNNNSAVKYLKNFKKIVRIALGNKWLNHDPFINYKAKINEVERIVLTHDELEVLINKNLHFPRLEQVRDIFVFCCFTGLAYADVKKLTQDDIIKGIDGDLWISTKRTKTDTRSKIPLLPMALEIIERYKDRPDVVANNVLLPVLSNQKSNAYLKEIADLCSINKSLTTHLARHTFATTITLNNGVPLETVSKMLGHRSIRTTQHYAKMNDRKVSEDMEKLKSILINKDFENKNKLTAM